MDRDVFLLAPARHAKRMVRSGAHPQNDFDLSKKNRISSKSGFPPHRYYSRAWLHQKSSTSHLGKHGNYAAAPIWRKNCPNGVQIGRESTIFTPNRILPHPAPTQPPGQRPPERSHGHETGNKRWTMTFSCWRQLDTQNEWSNPEHSPKTISICQKNRIPSKSCFPPHRYYSRAWLHQKSSTSHVERTPEGAAAPIWRKYCRLDV